MTDARKPHLRLVPPADPAESGHEEPYHIPLEPEPGAVALAKLEKALGGDVVAARLGWIKTALCLGGAATVFFVLSRIDVEPLTSYARYAAIACGGGFLVVTAWTALRWKRIG